LFDDRGALGFALGRTFGLGGCGPFRLADSGVCGFAD
jgi:hypothetical protein